MTTQLPAYGTTEYYRYIGRKGGQARAAQPDFTQHCRAAGLRSAQVNDMAALGRKGARAFIRKYGYIKFFHFWRNWKLANPSRHERQVMAMLELLKYPYRREAMVLGHDVPLAVDFYIPDANDAVIEVNGRVHYDPRFDHPNRPQTRYQLDVLRRQRLERAGFRVLELDYLWLSREPLAVSKIAVFLMG